MIMWICPKCNKLNVTEKAPVVRCEHPACQAERVRE